MNRILIYITVFFLITHTAYAVELRNTERVIFTSSKTNAVSLLIENHLIKQFPNYSDSAPAHMIGFADINGDKTPEIFVHINDQFNFCDENYTCETYVYVYEGNKLIEVGVFKTGGEVRLLPETTDNIRNLMVSGPTNDYEFYNWKDGRYERQGK